MENVIKAFITGCIALDRIATVMEGGSPLLPAANNGKNEAAADTGTGTDTDTGIIPAAKRGNKAAAPKAAAPKVDVKKLRERGTEIIGELATAKRLKEVKALMVEHGHEGKFLDMPDPMLPVFISDLEKLVAGGSEDEESLV